MGYTYTGSLAFRKRLRAVSFGNKVSSSMLNLNSNTNFSSLSLCIQYASTAQSGIRVQVHVQETIKPLTS